ncbi:hypothetical protein NDU88_004098 [Pleurodeles waltl]|uniref:Olfactory receptor n=1 Tax=Pleurodeles waltl TaxID=8319 RepID=A0AAV7QBY5_PLEWA|nr:hypothetical protein NDU88_004098 [Pleurodeles waltl]
MILIIRLSPPLGNPMYYFISNLSFIDFLLSSIIVPSTLWNFMAPEAMISLTGCALQIFGFIAMAFADSSLLSLMAYDRYIAICHPLHYRIIMNNHKCFKLVALTYTGSVMYSLTFTVPTMCLPFCGNNEIPHFICEMPTLLKLACTDTLPNYILLFTVGGLLGMCFFTSIFISYMFILSTVLKCRSAESRRKAFSTCGSHLMAVTLFYSTASTTYFRPSSSNVLTHNGVVTFFYTVLVPMLNPLIYSVRNKDVKMAVATIASRLCAAPHRVA